MWHVPLVHPHTIVTCVHVVPTHTQNSLFMSLIHYHMGVVQCVYGKMCVHETLSYIMRFILSSTLN